MWGTDLSGTRRGAGGVGGLVKVYDVTTSKHLFPGFDGNGNVTVLADGSTGAAQAIYEYGPFGELLRLSGAWSRTNPLRFSTKYQDDESDMSYYGYRFYNSSLGRWLSRDPIEERGGANLCGFVGNAPTVRTDGLGLEFVPPFPNRCPCTCKSVVVTGRPADPPALGLYIVAGDDPYARFGNLMTVTWTVDGPPENCLYGQDEKGTSHVFPPAPRVPYDKTYSNTRDVRSAGISIRYGLHTANYEDYMGIGPLTHPLDNGLWGYSIDLEIDFTCESYTGVKMIGKTVHFEKTGTFTF